MVCVEVCQRDFVANVWKNLVPEDIADSDKCFYICITDGAACYSGLAQLLMRIDLSVKTRVYIRAYYIPETGFNKTALDGVFATHGKAVMAHIQTGDTDAYDEVTLFNALKKMTTKENVAVFLIDTDRSQMRVPQHKIKKIKIKRVASKTFNWVEPTCGNKV